MSVVQIRPRAPLENRKFAKFCRHCVVTIVAFYPKFYTEVKERDRGLFDPIKGKGILYYRPFALDLSIGLVVLLGDSFASVLLRDC